MADHEQQQQQQHITGSMGASGEVLPEKKNGILSTLFSSCAPDPRGSVHRAWGISLLFVVVYFALSIFESKYYVLLLLLFSYLRFSTHTLYIVLQ